MSEVTKRANKAIKLLDGLVDQLHYFYGDHPNFRKVVLNDAIEIENVIKDSSVNKKETFRRIAKKYEEYYRKKQEAVDNAVAGTNDAKLNERIKQRYRLDFKQDTE